MSSIRVAVASFVLVLALGAGGWAAVQAFPLYGQTQGQRPPRDPLTPEAHHRLAQQYWQKANSDTSLTPEQKLETILKGIAAEDRALAINPDFVPSITYKNTFLRMQANMTDDPELRTTLLRQADELATRRSRCSPRRPRAPREWGPHRRRHRSSRRCSISSSRSASEAISRCPPRRGT
jgi:hypothetical protein